MTRWAHVFILAVVSASILAVGVGGCSEENLSTADKIVADANTVGQTVSALPDALGPLIPPSIVAILKSLGLLSVAAFSVWQEIRRRGLLTTGKVLTRAIESTDPETAGRVKMAVETEARKANAEPKVRATVKKLKAS